MSFDRYLNLNILHSLVILEHMKLFVSSRVVQILFNIAEKKQFRLKVCLMNISQRLMFMLVECNIFYGFGFWGMYWYLNADHMAGFKFDYYYLFISKLKLVTLFLKKKRLFCYYY